MMQKNLSCKDIGAAQKNMISFSVVLVVVNFLFLVLGALLFVYAEKFQIALPLMDGSPKTDLLFPEIALNSGLPIWVGVSFMLGLIAAAYSSADSALTALTTSFCVDFLEIEKREQRLQKSIRKKVHIGMSLLLVVVIIIFKYILDRNIIDGLLTVATYTYGPLLGLFTFGVFTKYTIKDQYSWMVAGAALTLIIGIAQLPKEWLGGYEIGYELLPLNGLLTFIGLYLIRERKA
jgi:Na+/proline symporter